MSASTPEPAAATSGNDPSPGGLRRVLEKLGKIADVIARALFLMMLGTVFAMTVGRDVFSEGFPWMDDLSRYLQIWVVYASAYAVTMKGEHITMDAFYRRMRPLSRLTVRRFTGISSLVFCAIAGYLAWVQAAEVLRLGEVSSTGVFPAFLGYAALPFGFILLTAASLYYLVFRSRQDDVRS